MNRSGLAKAMLIGSAIMLIGAAGYFENAVAFAEDRQASEITVYGNEELGPVKLLQGFLHGIDNASFDRKLYARDLLAKLKPQFWRIGLADAVRGDYKLAKSINPDMKVTLVVSDIYADSLKGGYKNVRPWEDWGAYERDITSIVTKVKNAQGRIDYWDVWSEPDDPNMWLGTCDQVMELFKRTYHAIRSAVPGAKVVGPSISGFNKGGTCPQGFLRQFLKYLYANDLRFGAISWHEFDAPEDIPAHVDRVRTAFKEKPSLGTPEIHINEVMGPNESLIPGWIVGYLYYLEKVKVDWVTRACWDVSDNGGEEYSNCTAGVDGLFFKDNRTPRHSYSVYRAYAEMTGNKLRSESSTPRTVALATKDDAQKALRLLVGQYEGAPSAVTIRVVNYPYAVKTVEVQVLRIPNTNIRGALPGGPIKIGEKILPLKNGTLVLPIKAMADGDAYVLLLTPKE